MLLAVFHDKNSAQKLILTGMREDMTVFTELYRKSAPRHPGMRCGKNQLRAVEIYCLKIYVIFIHATSLLGRIKESIERIVARMRPEDATGA